MQIMKNKETIYEILSTLLKDNKMEDIVDAINIILEENISKEKKLIQQRQDADELYEKFLLYANTYYPSIYTDEIVKNQMQLVENEPNYTLNLYAKALETAKKLTSINLEDDKPCVTITTDDNGKKTTKTYTTNDLNKVLQSWDDALSAFFDKYSI